MTQQLSTLRLFIALPVPQAVSARLGALQRAWKAHGLPFRWTRAEGLHLTLVFLGGRPAQEVPEIAQALGRAVAGRAPLRLAVRGLGCFPTPVRPRVVWAGLTGDLDALDGLRRALGAELQAAGVPFQRQPFRPHITLGRAARPAPPGETTRLQAQLAAGQETSYGAWKADSVELVRSQLQPGGSIYTTAARATLGTAPPPAVTTWTAPQRQEP